MTLKSLPKAKLSHDVQNEKVQHMSNVHSRAETRKNKRNRSKGVGGNRENTEKVYQE